MTNTAPQTAQKPSLLTRPNRLDAGRTRRLYPRPLAEMPCPSPDGRLGLHLRGRQGDERRSRDRRNAHPLGLSHRPRQVLRGLRQNALDHRRGRPERDHLPSAGRVLNHGREAAVRRLPPDAVWRTRYSFLKASEG